MAGVHGAAISDNQPMTESGGAESPLCLWLSGLQGAGKSTLASHLVKALSSRHREVRLIDGDAFRAEHSRDLGFSRQDRETNVLRMAYAARAFAEGGCDVVVAAMSPYRDAREKARLVVSPSARFLEVHVATPLAVCEARDTKGLYAAAARGEIHGLSGVDAPFEPPDRPLMRVSMESIPPDRAAGIVMDAVPW